MRPLNGIAVGPADCSERISLPTATVRVQGFRCRPLRVLGGAAQRCPRRTPDVARVITIDSCALLDKVSRTVVPCAAAAEIAVAHRATTNLVRVRLALEIAG